jgi:hypothetical protein
MKMEDSEEEIKERKKEKRRKEGKMDHCTILIYQVLTASRA